MPGLLIFLALVMAIACGALGMHFVDHSDKYREGYKDGFEAGKKAIK